MGSLHDRWGAMDAEQLRAELFRQFCSEGMMRMAEFERIQRLEKRIGEQRQRINQLQDERHEMGIKLAHALAAEGVSPRVETTPAGATVDTNNPTPAHPPEVVRLIEAARDLFVGGFIDAGAREHDEWSQELSRRIVPLRAALTPFSETGS